MDLADQLVVVWISKARLIIGVFDAFNFDWFGNADCNAVNIVDCNAVDVANWYFSWMCWRFRFLI